MRLVEISANTGRVLTVYGIHFISDAQVVDYAVEYHGLPRPDLDQPAIWQHPTRDTLIVVDYKDELVV